MCEAYDLHIPNGRICGDLEGNYTCLTRNCFSVVDYCIMSTLFNYITRFEVAHDTFTSSVHLPVVATFNVNSVQAASYTDTSQLDERLRYAWHLMKQKLIVSPRKQPLRDGSWMDDG